MGWKISSEKIRRLVGGNHGIIRSATSTGYMGQRGLVLASPISRRQGRRNLGLNERARRVSHGSCARDAYLIRLRHDRIYIEASASLQRFLYLYEPCTVELSFAFIYVNTPASRNSSCCFKLERERGTASRQTTWQYQAAIQLPTSKIESWLRLSNLCNNLF